jgi:hypothetical protein
VAVGKIQLALLAYDEDAEIVHVFMREILDLEGMPECAANDELIR